MANAWINHVKAYAKKHKCSYREAMSKAKASYKGGKGKKQTKKDKKDESKGMKGRKKGRKSKTHKGDKDFTTKKGDKDYHEGGKNVKKSKKPY